MKILGFLVGASLALPAGAYADFAGGYVGGGVGLTQGDIDVDGGTLNGQFDFDDGSALSFFGGYNVRDANLVYGGEVAINRISNMFVPGGFGDDDEIENLVDLRGRVGFVTDNVMVYGALGYSFGAYTEPGFDDYSLGGLAVGAGVEFEVDDGLFLGADYTVRMLEGEGDDNGVDAASDVSSLTIRAGYSF